MQQNRDDSFELCSKIAGFLGGRVVTNKVQRLESCPGSGGPYRLNLTILADTHSGFLAFASRVLKQMLGILNVYMQVSSVLNQDTRDTVDFGKMSDKCSAEPAGVM